MFPCTCLPTIVRFDSVWPPPPPPPPLSFNVYSLNIIVVVVRSLHHRHRRTSPYLANIVYCLSSFYHFQIFMIKTQTHTREARRRRRGEMESARERDLVRKPNRKQLCCTSPELQQQQPKTNWPTELNLLSQPVEPSSSSSSITIRAVDFAYASPAGERNPIAIGNGQPSSSMRLRARVLRA